LEREARVVMEEAPAKAKEPEDQLPVMIDKIPTLAWSCLPDGTTEFLNQRWIVYSAFAWKKPSAGDGKRQFILKT
jgi:hypothetical protein